MPDFFIVGGQRCGTTSLYYYLNQHPLIFLPSIKELHYYSQNSIPSYLSQITNKQDYLSLYNTSNSNFKGDASTSYLMDMECPELIKNDYPNSKIIICLRNPIERSYSAYLAQFRSNRTNLDFDDIIKIDANFSTGDEQKSLNLLTSNYFDPVSKYIEIFKRENVKIIFTEEFGESPLTILSDILLFLNIKQPFKEIDLQQKNKFKWPKNKLYKLILNNSLIRHSIIPKIIPSFIRHFIFSKLTIKTKPKMKKESRIYLKNKYSDDVKKLSNLLDITSPWKDFN
jgi:hypothetical protein